MSKRQGLEKFARILNHDVEEASIQIVINDPPDPVDSDFVSCFKYYTDRSK